MHRLWPGVVALVLSVLAGCAAFAAESRNAYLRPVHLDWSSFITAYGPMAVMLGWCFYDAREKRQEDKEHRAEWKTLLRMNIEALTQVKEALSRFRRE